jgi:hypothetical protein
MRNCTTPANLAKVTHTFGIGCDLLEDKFHRVQAFIQLMENPDEILAFFTNNFDFDTTSQFLSTYWIKSAEITGSSVQFFIRALDRLNTSHIVKMNLEPPSAPPPPDNFSIQLPWKRFDEMKQELLSEISALQRPCIADILQDRVDPEDYYETFAIILHLIQDGNVRYCAPTQTLEVENYE